MAKKCFYCGSFLIVKNGFNNNKQSYLCKTCGRRFIRRQTIDIQHLWHDYIFGKQTIQQLCEKYKISTSTVARRLSEQRTTRIISSSKQVVVLMDTVYWGRNFGVTVFRDTRSKEILWCKFVSHETVLVYREEVEFLSSSGFKIDAIVCDGFKGLIQSMSKYKIQLCQFHHVKSVLKYTTRKPKTQAVLNLNH